VFSISFGNDGASLYAGKNTLRLPNVFTLHPNRPLFPFDRYSNTR
jgi:hypothetical protein